MIQYQLDANVIHVQSVLTEMANVSDQILHAGTTGSELEVRRGVDKMRKLSSDLIAIEDKYKAYFDTRPESEKVKIIKILDQYRKGEPFRKAWTERYKNIGPIEIVIELPDGPGGILDMTIPEAWDWGVDVIAFSNRSDTRLIKSMQARGQARIVVYGSPKSAQLEKIKGVVYIENEEQVIIYFSTLAPEIPTRICIFEKIIQSKEEIPKEEVEIYDKLTQKIQNAFERAIVNVNTIRLLGNRWISQGIKNLPMIASHPSFKHLAAVINKFPLVIISPGPSLDKNIQYLSRIQSRAILLAPAQTVMALQNAGITPDIVMIADPNDLLYLLKDFDATKVSAILVGVSCHPAIYHRYHGKIISFNVNGPIDNWVSDIFQDDAPKGACGSVSSMALLLGGIMQCDPIILVGQDLSFAGEKQYAENTSEGDVSVEFDEDKNTFTYSKANAGYKKIIDEMLGKNYQGSIRTLPGYYGGRVNSKPDYCLFHAEFERIAAATLAFEEPPRLLNCTEGGAYIEGFEHIALLQAIKELEENDVPEIDKAKLFQQVFESADKKIRYDKLRNVLGNIKNGIEESIVLATECHALAVKAEKGKINLNLLSEKEKKLMKEITTSNFISLAVQDEIRNIIKLSGLATTLKQNIGASKLLYKIILKETRKIRPHIIKSAKDIDTLYSKIEKSGSFSSKK